MISSFVFVGMAKTVLNISVRIGIKNSIFFIENHAFLDFFTNSYFVKILFPKIRFFFAFSIKKFKNICYNKNIILKRGILIMINEVQEILINESEIQEKVKYLAEQINKDYAGKDIVLMIILKGSVVFSADLMRYLNVNVSLDFMQVSSYGSSSVSGELKILKDGQIDVNGKNVIIAEDIIDSGNTLSALVKLLKKRGANVEICTLLSKPARRETQVDVKYEGFEIPDEFVVGYGMDYDERFRNLPYIGILKREVYGG